MCSLLSASWGGIRKGREVILDDGEEVVDCKRISRRRRVKVARRGSLERMMGMVRMMIWFRQVVYDWMILGRILIVSWIVTWIVIWIVI